MPRIKVNLADIPDGPTSLDSGKYRARLLSCEEQESSTGNPMLRWTWVVAEGENEGGRISSITSLLDHALFGFKRHCAAFGAEGETDAVDTDEFLDRTAIIVVGRRVRKNRTTGEDQEFSDVVDVQVDPKGGKATAKPVAKAPVASGARRPIRKDDIPF